MEDHHTEKLAEVNSSIIFVGKIECLIHQKSNDESELHDSHEKSSIEDIHLIILLKLISVFVLFHESTIRNGIDIGTKFQDLKWLNRGILTS